LHRSVAEALLEDATATAEPELLARHFTQAGLAETAIEWWSIAGEQSLERSALVEGIEQFTRAVDLIAAMPNSPALRRKEIKLRVALIFPLMHVKGYAASEAKTAAERARVLIEQADALGEALEDPLSLFWVILGDWNVNLVAFNGDRVRKLAVQFLSLAKNQQTRAPLMIGNRMMGQSLLCSGDIVEGRAYFDQALALYDPAEHRSLAARVGVDNSVAALNFRALALYLLGYPDAALTEVEHGVRVAREIDHVTSLMHALGHTELTLILCGRYVTASAQSDELVSLADAKGALLWKAAGTMCRGRLLARTGRASEAVQAITLGLSEFHSRGATCTVWTPLAFLDLASAYADLDQFDQAWHWIDEAAKTVQINKARMWEAELHRVTGEVALKSAWRDEAKAQAHFDRALVDAPQ
jgi:tetratricopeptide (TPR) repeat protein